MGARVWKVAAGVAAIGPGGAALAQPCGGWTLRGAIPVHRYSHAAALEGQGGAMLLFGGYDPQEGYRGDTWRWNPDSAVWSQLPVGPAPAARVFHTMTLDNARGRIVLFGGLYLSILADTWEWDGSAWSRRQPPLSPPGRYGHAAAYDAARGRLVVFGGHAAAPMEDTWEWDGAGWAAKSPAASPPARYYHAMAYDAVHARVVLFGGLDGGAYLDDTWEWDGAQWLPRAPAISPIGRASHAMAFDSGRGRVILFGGVGAGYMGDTWEWEPAFGAGGTWIWNNTPGPGNRQGHSMVYDPARHAAVLVGGYAGGATMGDTWELACTPPCYPNCDGSTEPPVLNVADFICFLNSFAAAEPRANCDNSTVPPVLNVADFVCFMTRYAAGCP